MIDTIHTGESIDADLCQNCGHAYDPRYEGHFVDTDDVGPDATGGTAEIFRNDTEHCGNVWGGFKEEDVGPWCDDCSYIVQQRRSHESG